MTDVVIEGRKYRYDPDPDKFTDEEQANGLPGKYLGEYIGEQVVTKDESGKKFKNVMTMLTFVDGLKRTNIYVNMLDKRRGPFAATSKLILRVKEVKEPSCVGAGCAIMGGTRKFRRNRKFRKTKKRNTRRKISRRRHRSRR